MKEKMEGLEGKWERRVESVKREMEQREREIETRERRMERELKKE